MEPWQVSHIQRNLLILQNFTSCNSSFRAILLKHGVLSGSDISQLDAVKTIKGLHSESEFLYSVLITRTGAFNALIDACERTRQTGTLQILKQAHPDETIIYFQPEHIKESTTWNELSNELKNEIGNKLVVFQGKRVKLSDCYNNLHHLIDGKFLTELRDGKAPTLVNNQVPDQLEYYIQRTLRSRTRLKSSVFQQHCNDVFVIAGLERYELTSLVAGARTDVSGNQLSSLTLRFILLEHEGDFESISKLTRSPVHWIRYYDDFFEWVKSSGSVKSLQKYVDDDDYQDCFPEVELATKGKRINIIPDSPGMGKTVLLANVAHQISKEKPNMLIRFIVIKQLVQALTKKPVNIESIASLIAKQSSEFECGRKIIETILVSEPCILMFDGFDEVHFHQIDIAKKILRIIATLKSAQIFVTTRPHLRDELENTLEVLGYTINPFTESDQVDLLLKFWKMKGAADEALKQFATECVNTISSTMTDFERDITGIPFQCRLLAECYTEQALRCSVPGGYSTISRQFPRIIPIFEMYEMQVKMRLQNMESQVEQIKNAHIYYALELLFPKQARPFQSLKTPSISLHELCAAGLLETTNSENVRFVHRTFAEFFVAWFAVEMKMPEKITPFLLDELLATKSQKEYVTTPYGKEELGTSCTFNYPEIAYFINGFSRIYSQNQGNDDQSSRVSMLMNSVYYEQVSHIFLASAVNDYQFIPQAVSLCFDISQLNKNRRLDVYELLLVAAKYSSVALMKTICSQTDLIHLKTQSKFSSFVLTPLHVAVQRGNYDLAEFLTKRYEQGLENLHCLLHFSVFESLNEKKEIIKNKVQIIKFLSQKCTVWLDEKDSSGTVPLLQKNVNCELIKCLIECGADVNILDKNRNSILHKITESPVTPEFYRWLVVSLNKLKFKYFNHPNLKKVSPLHCALVKVELLEGTLKYFKLNRADFIALDEDEESPLFYAVRGGRSVSLISKLIELGADCKKRNKVNENVLHISAKHGHYDAMKYFLETLKMNANVKENVGSTPLHFALMKRSLTYESMQQLLIISGANVNAKTWEGGRYTPFRKALSDGKGLSVSIIRLMEKHGLTINPEEASEDLKNLLSNRNIKSWEIDEEFVQVLEFLIAKGGKVKHVDHHQGVESGTCNVWESEGLKRNMAAIIEATDLSCLWDKAKTSGLLTELEIEEIENRSTDSFNKCERFFTTVQTKKGSFERVCILVIASNQMSSLSLLREALCSSVTSGDSNIFVMAPNFTNQFVDSQHNSSLNKMALVTSHPDLTISRIRDTISESTVVVKEADISSHLQKPDYEDVIVVKVRVVTAQLVTKFDSITVSKVIFVCGAVDEDVENCHVVTDSVSTWDAISTHYLHEKALVKFFHYSYSPISEFFVTPLIFTKLFQLQLPQNEYSILRFDAGHIDTEFQFNSYLCPTIFHYILPDKLVFQRISAQTLHEYTRFGRRIGYFGRDDIENVDFIVVEQSHQFDEICKQTFKNVHLVDYDHEKCLFKLVRTWGWQENIQCFLKKPLCKGFPHCACTSNNENLVVSLLIQTKNESTVHRFKFLLPINELTPLSLTFMKLEDAEEVFNITVLLNHLGKKIEIEHLDLIGKSHSEQLVKLVAEHLSTFLTHNELRQIAINTLFPNLGKRTDIRGHYMEKYQELGILKQTDSNLMVFAHQSLAWYIVAKLLVGLSETPDFKGITNDLRKSVFRNCFKPKKVKTLSGYAAEFELRTRVCFRFIDTLLEKNDTFNFNRVLKGIIAVENEGHKWVHACVNANLYHLLKLIISLNINELSFAFESEKLVMLAVNYADSPTAQLVFELYEKKSKEKMTGITLCLTYDVISMGLLAVLRGNYELVKYLLHEHGFGSQLQRENKMSTVYHYCLVDTVNNLTSEVGERIRIMKLLLRTDKLSIEHIRLYIANIHVDLLCYLINRGVKIHSKDDENNNLLHICPHYLTPEEYHKVVGIIHASNTTSIARLFKELNGQGETALHVAVQHLELLDETLQLFAEAGVNFNAINEAKNSICVHAAKHFRSHRLLDTLRRFEANLARRSF